VEDLKLIWDGLPTIGQYVVTNAGGIAALVGVGLALYALGSWKREYRFKRDAELLEEALVLFFQAEHAIAYLRNGMIFTHELANLELPSELKEGHCESRYKYTYVIRTRFDEKQEVFNKLYAIELRFRARFRDESTAEFAAMKERVKELLLGASEYSQSGLQRDRLASLERLIWKDWAARDPSKDAFGNQIATTVHAFERRCRERMR
jgi:hypothetical protein